MQIAISNPLVIALIILSVVVLVLVGIVIWMHTKMKRFLVGFDSANVADSLSYVSKNLDDLHTFREEMETYLKHVEKRLRKSVQSVHTVRFNPFKGAGEGGNQSFATAFLNEEGDGVIISSLNAREHVRVFSKPVVKHTSDFELSEEESEALEKGKENIILNIKGHI